MPHRPLSGAAPVQMERPRGHQRDWVVTCVYVNPDLDQFWLVRVYRCMTRRAITTANSIMWLRCCATMYHKQLSCYAVLMDSWYATKAIAHKLKEFESVSSLPPQIRANALCGG